MAEPTLKIGDKINGYTIRRYIGSGSFGNVYEVIDQKGISKAIKIPIRTDDRDGNSSLQREIEVYKVLSNKEKGIANMKVEKNKADGGKLIIMDLLGCSLEALLQKRKKLSINEIAWRAIQMLDVIRYIHSFGYIHRDIKPDNFVVGHDNEDDLYCIDFGLAKRYVDSTGNHIPFSKSRRFVGTARYASLAAHEGLELSRRDDLESIGYILVYLFKGRLPWQGIRHKDKRKRYKLIEEMKRKETAESLCKDMPREFLIYLKYVKTLDFDEKPHYTSLKNMFAKLLE
jgi:serine/threonine protein kinase